jgi:predicted ribosomally synthesized peptide with nif11-like leader
MPSNDDQTSATTIAAFLDAVKHDESLQQQLRLASTATELSELATAAGFDLKPAELVKHYARQLLDADDALAVRNFNLCSWDAGELLYLLKHWEG